MSEYTDQIGRDTASNMSVQPGSNHPPILPPVDVRDHPARSMPDMDWQVSHDPMQYMAQPASKMMQDRKAGK